MRLHPFLAAAAIGLSVASATPPARADDAAKAAVLAEAAAARAQRGERRVAIDLYDDAYAAAPRREYLREIAVLYDALAMAGDARDVRLAISFYERYLAGNDPLLDRAAVQAHLARLREWKARMASEPIQRQERVPVHLLAYRSDETYDVELGNTTCTTPCTLVVPPGVTTLRTKGAGEVDLQLVVPPRPGQIRLQHVDKSGFLAGAILTPAGFAVGAGMWAIGLACGNSSGGCYVANFVTWPVVGVSMMIAGIVLLARGRPEPPPDANRVEIIAGGGKPRLWLTSGGVMPLVGGGAAGTVGFAF